MGASTTARWLPPAAIIGATVAAYLTSFQGTFQFDDWNVIVDEPRVHSLAAWWHSMPGIRPLLKLSYAANWQSTAGIAGFHFFNLVLHGINALLVYLLLAKFEQRTTGSADQFSTAFAATLIFALHPVQTEAVTYLCGRSAALVASFSLASLLVWIEGEERAAKLLTYLVSPALFACALASKETAFILPCALLLWRCTDPRNLDWRQFFKRSIAHWLLLAVAIALVLTAAPYQRLIEVSLHARGRVTNLLTQIEAVIYLLLQVVRLDRLNADPMLPAITSTSAAALIEAAALVALLVTGVLTVRRRPAIAFGILWFFLWLAPTNSFIPRLDVVNDRQLYLAIVGPAWLAALALEALAQTHRNLATACLLAIGLTLATATSMRNLVYRSELAFWDDVTEKAPHNARAWNNLGFAYAQACRSAQASKAFLHALEVDRSYVRAAVNVRLLHAGALACRGPGSGEKP